MQEKNSPLIHFERVSLRYGVGLEVFRDLTFAVQPASMHFLTGASGAGKTTLLKLILMILLPTSGRMSLFGHDAAQITGDQVAEFRRRMGVVFQDFRLLNHLTTYENVALPLRILGREESDYRPEVIELLKWVGLGRRMHVSPQMLSGGEKQRAAIARATITRPEILLADEPTGNVDPHLAHRLLRLFVEMNRSGTAIIIATHDLDLVESIPANHSVLANKKIHPMEPSND